MVDVILSETARDKDLTEITDNAICAFGKVLMYQQTDQENLLPLWLSWLPLSAEELEASQCHAIFAGFLEQNNPHMWGPNFKYLPKVLEVIGFCLSENGKPFVREETINQLVVLTKGMHSKDHELVQKAILTLDQSYQEVLKKAIMS